MGKIKCTDCVLHKFAKTNCFPPRIGSDPRLAIYLDYPNTEEDRKGRIGESQATQLLFWMLKRMSVSLDNVMIDYTLKCHKPKKQLTRKDDRLISIKACRKYIWQNLDQAKHIKAIIIMGSISCEAFLNAPLKSKEGAYWNTYSELKKKYSPKIFVTYSPAYARETPSETVRIYRMLWQAAEAASLNPTYNPNIKPFDYDL